MLVVKKIATKINIHVYLPSKDSEASASELQEIQGVV